MSQKKFTLALSGGGAKGLAHIGAIKAFEEFNIEIEAVSGTSAGSMVAYFLAAGLKSAEMQEIAKSTNFYSAFKVSFSKIGIVSIGNIKNILKKKVGVDKFEDLSMPLSIGVSNIKTGEAEYLESGDLYNSIVASCSIPLVFSPVKIGNNVYVDGGLTANLPIEPLMKYDFPMIGINVVGFGNGEAPESYAQLVERTIDIVAWQNTNSYLNKCDIKITPEKTNNYGTFDFKKVDELVDIGYEETKKVLKEYLN
jgi:NTE family protein